MQMLIEFNSLPFECLSAESTNEANVILVFFFLFVLGSQRAKRVNDHSTDLA